MRWQRSGMTTSITIDVGKRHIREINEENTSVEATRYSFGFGVDVPLMTLFQR